MYHLRSTNTLCAYYISSVEYPHEEEPQDLSPEALNSLMQQFTSHGSEL